MNIKLKSIKLQNFKGIKELLINFGSSITNVFGQNASGKTTIVDSFMWLLFNKDSQGVEKFNIRPLDKDGNRIDNVEIMVEAILDVDGKEVTLQKIQKQNWVKKRGTNVTELQGNPNSYEINGIPKAEKEYKEYISSLIDESLFKLITDPRAFTSLKWKEQRAILLKLVSDVSDEDVVFANPKFGELNLNDFTAEELKAKADKALKEWKKKQAEIPARIDEVHKSIVDVDFAEHELQKNSLLEHITEVENQEDDSNKAYEEIEKLNKEYMDIKFAISDIEREANEDLIKEKRALQKEIDKAFDDFNAAASSHSSLERQIEHAKNEIKLREQKRQRLLDDWKRENALGFDDSSLVCSYCGQEYPVEKKDQLRADFETHKKESLDNIVAIGNEIKVGIDSVNEKIKELEAQIEDVKAKKIEANGLTGRLKEKLDALPNEMDLTGHSEYQKLKEKLIDIEEKQKSMDTGASYRQQLRIKKLGLKEELESVNKVLAGAENNVRAEERISELKAEQKEIGQKVADQEKELFLLEEFMRAKIDMLSSRINSKFNLVTWKLFEMQINGGMREICECEYKGVPFSSINSGHKIIAGLDIISSLLELYEVSAPIFIDNAESINDYNIPNMDCQMVLLKVSEDKELRVEAD